MKEDERGTFPFFLPYFFHLRELNLGSDGVENNRTYVCLSFFSPIISRQKPCPDMLLHQNGLSPLICEEGSVSNLDQSFSSSKSNQSTVMRLNVMMSHMSFSTVSAEWHQSDWIPSVQSEFTPCPGNSTQFELSAISAGVFGDTETVHVTEPGLLSSQHWLLS